MYNLFISHSWAYGDAYDRLIDILDTQKGFSYKNYSVPKDDPIHFAPNDQLLAGAIANKVSACNAIIVLAGVYATYSKWINIEVRIARSLYKPIIAVEPWASEKTSKFVRDNADKIVGWRGSSVVDAVRELAYVGV